MKKQVVSQKRWSSHGGISQKRDYCIYKLASVSSVKFRWWSGYLVLSKFTPELIFFLKHLKYVIGVLSSVVCVVQFSVLWCVVEWSAAMGEERGGAKRNK